MKYEKGETLVLDNKKEYKVVDTFSLNDKQYLFLISIVKKELSLVWIENEVLHKIDSDEEYEKVFNTLCERNKKEIEDIIK